MDVVIVCHTEFGFAAGEKIIFAKEGVEGVLKGVPALLDLAKRYGAKVTFAVCPEAALHFPGGRGHEVGLHVHPGQEEFRDKSFTWVVGDEYLKRNCKQSTNSSALVDYSFEEQLGMLRAGKEYLREKLGIDPKVFVAGRFSLNNNTVRALVREGFTHDASGVPGLRTSYLDWSLLPRMAVPYHPSEKSYQEKGQLPLLMVPVSLTLFGRMVSPESAPECGLSWLKAAFLEYYRAGAPVFHIALHSPAMTSPYHALVMEKLLSFISQHNGVRYKFLSEIRFSSKSELRSSIVPYALAMNREVVKTALQKTREKLFGRLP